MGIAVPTKVVGMLVVSALPTKVVGMQAVNQISKIQEQKGSNIELSDQLSSVHFTWNRGLRLQALIRLLESRALIREVEKVQELVFSDKLK